MGYISLAASTWAMQPMVDLNVYDKPGQDSLHCRAVVSGCSISSEYFGCDTKYKRVTLELMIGEEYNVTIWDRVMKSAVIRFVLPESEGEFVGRIREMSRQPVGNSNGLVKLKMEMDGSFESPKKHVQKLMSRGV